MTLKAIRLQFLLKKEYSVGDAGVFSVLDRNTFLRNTF